jgi:hypothetical protein
VTTAKTIHIRGLASNTSSDLPLAAEPPNKATNAGAGTMKIAPTHPSKRIAFVNEGWL